MSGDRPTIEAPYALHYHIPGLGQRSHRRDTRVNPRIPLPPEVEPNVKVIEVMSPPPEYNPPPEMMPPQQFAPSPYPVCPPMRCEPPRCEVSCEQVEAMDHKIRQQEQNIQTLLNRATRIKEDLVSALGHTNANLQEERMSRALLGEHVNSIVQVCKRLSHDIDVLEEHIKQKELRLMTLENLIKNVENNFLNHQHAANSRIDRLEGSVQQLGFDINSAADRYRSVEKTLQALAARQDGNTEKLGQLEGKLNLFSNRIDGNLADILQQLSATRKELMGDILKNKTELNDRINELERKLMSHINLINDANDKQFDELYKKLMAALEGQQKKVDKDIGKMQKQIAAFEKNLLSELMKNFEPKLNQLFELLEHFKAETRDTFSDVKESIENLERVEDGKMKLMEERFEKEMGQLRKMVVLI